MWFKLKGCLIIYVFILMLSSMTRADARPLGILDEERRKVFVCDQGPWDPNCTDLSPFEDLPGDYSDSYAEYVEQVLANEWPGDAGIEALKAGVIAIRTFASRDIPCGSRTDVYCPYTTTCFEVEYNGSQAYWLNEERDQNPIQADHSAARSATDAMQLKRDDGQLACAKYHRDVGNPTDACVTVWCTSDPDDQETLDGKYDPVWPNTRDPIDVGMGQRASAAWARGTAAWEYRQILTHYYTKSDLINNNINNYYRWVWLTAGGPIVDGHYSSLDPTPDVVYINGAPLSVQFEVKNTGREQWSSDVTIWHRWNTPSGTQDRGGTIVAPSGLRPGSDRMAYSTVSAPNGVGPGDYVLEWDLKSGGQWFGDNGWPTLTSVVSVRNDTNPPGAPGSSVQCSTGHVRDEWSTHAEIGLNWPDAADGEGETGVDGYSIAWDQVSNTTPDSSVDTSASSATSGYLGDGNWYLHVRTVDSAGNASGSTHYGPYGIDTIAPSSVVTGSVATDPTKSWFYVEVSGSDAGSGVASYVVQYKVDSGSWQDYASVGGPGPRTLLFCGSRYNPGHTYYFRSQATDGVGHTESWGAAEWSVYIPAGTDPGGLSDARCPIMWKNYTIP